MKELFKMVQKVVRKWSIGSKMSINTFSLDVDGGIRQSFETDTPAVSPAVLLLLLSPPVTPLPVSRPLRRAIRVLLEKSSPYLPVALWSSRVLWVVALLFPCSLPLPDHSHSSLMEVVWRPRIAPAASSSSSSSLLSFFYSSVPSLLNHASVSFISASPPSLPFFPHSEGAVRGHPLFSPSWVCWHTVNLRFSFTSATPLF